MIFFHTWHNRSSSARIRRYKIQSSISELPTTDQYFEAPCSSKTSGCLYNICTHKKRAANMFATLWFSVVTTEQLSNFFLEDLVCLAKLAAWCNLMQNWFEFKFVLVGWILLHPYCTKFEPLTGRFEAFEWCSGGLNIQITTWKYCLRKKRNPSLFTDKRLSYLFPECFQLVWLFHSHASLENGWIT